MSEGGGFIGRMPGESLTGKRDINTEAWLSVVQAAIRIAVDFITMLIALVAALDIGRIGTYLAIAALLFLRTDYATEYLAKRTRNARMVALIYGAETWLPWAWLIGGMFVLGLIMPYAWAFYPATQEHYLVIFRSAMWEYARENGALVTANGADNVVIAFPLFARALILILCTAWVMTAGLLRKHFANEIKAFYPMKAVDPSMVGVDPDDWTKRAPASTSITVHLETLQRGSAENVGKPAVYPGDTVIVDDMTASPAQWLAVTHIAGINAKPTEETMLRNGFTQAEWRSFRDALVHAGLMVKLGNGDHGQNAGYDFTPEGREFFKEKRWDRRH